MSVIGISCEDDIVSYTINSYALSAQWSYSMFV